MIIQLKPLVALPVLLGLALQPNISAKEITPPVTNTVASYFYTSKSPSIVQLKSSTIQFPDTSAAYTASVAYDQAQAAALAAAKAKAAQIAAEQAQEEAQREAEQTYVAPVLAPGSHTDWMAAAGISPSDYGYVDYIVSNESGWQYWIVNHEGSGATGLGQALPASKMAPYGADYLTNPVTQLKWANAYAVERYGSWYNAYIFWSNHRYW